MTLSINVNSETHRLLVDPETPLLWVLRESLHLNGTKYGCGIGACGACTVLLEGEAIRSCLIPIESVNGKSVTTIEGLQSSNVGRELQSAWREQSVPQCGYCQAGQLMSATALLSKIPKPTDQDIDQAMSGNLCRCGTYKRIKKAIKQASE